MQIPKRRPPIYTDLPSDLAMSSAKKLDLEKDLKRLKEAKKELSREVSRLAENGDFSENAEYQLAKGRLRGVNHRITVLERALAVAVVIRPNGNGSVADIGSKVRVEIDGEQKIYTILGSAEADPSKGVISRSSPLGAAICGKRVGEKFVFSLPLRAVEGVLLEIFLS